MPCWFYDKKDLRNTPSMQNGLDAATEARYRREGAKLITDAGTKMGLRYDTCYTGAVYFHRFYMSHSFTEFHRHVIGASCLFLAGKVEETPKKCKDVVKMCRSLLTEQQFAVFKDNPREEIMTSERILLQTLKFDLQIEHPYTHIVRFGKLIYGDKNKIQEVVQMAWTFINDSVCTTVCLQWEAEIIATAMLYLSTRLSKLEVTDWAGRVPGTKGKWWEALVEGLCQELIEDICHQLLDLYSKSSQKGQDSPPITTTVQTTFCRNFTGPTPKKQPKADQQPSVTATPESTTTNHSVAPHQPTSSYPTVPASYTGPNYPTLRQDPNITAAPISTQQYTQNNPYVSSQMYSSSFMTGEGKHNLETLMHQTDRKQPQPHTYAQNVAIANYQNTYHDPMARNVPHNHAPHNHAPHVPPQQYPNQQYPYTRNPSPYSGYNRPPGYTDTNILRPAYPPQNLGYRPNSPYRPLLNQPPGMGKGLPTVRITGRR